MSYKCAGQQPGRSHAWVCFILSLMMSTAAIADTAASWSHLNIDKRCEGLLTFLQTASAKDVPEWAIIKPQCVVAGGAEGDVSWSIDASWKKGNKALPLRYMVTESKSQKPQTTWCVVKGKKSGCAAPWENAFSHGGMFAKPEDAATAFQGVLRLSQGFLSLASKLDEWVGKGSEKPRIFDLAYVEFVKAWAQAPRSLPVKKEIFAAEYIPDADNSMNGMVKFKGAIPGPLRDCLGCPKSSCELSPISFSFSGLALTFTRDLTPDESKASSLKTARVSWIMMEPTPFIAGEPKWPFLCGEHRFNIQKI